MEALYLKKKLQFPSFVQCVYTASPIAQMPFRFLIFSSSLSKDREKAPFTLHPHLVFIQASLFGSIKLVMVCSACSLRLEIAAGYSRAAPCRRLMNASTVSAPSESLGTQPFKLRCFISCTLKLGDNNISPVTRLNCSRKNCL